MKHTVWIVLDIVLAAFVALLGNIIASYLQERFDLTDPVRFVFVAVLFAACLVLLLLVTLKRSRTVENPQGGATAPIGNPDMRVRQFVRELRGRLRGVKIGKVTGGKAEVKQKICTVGESGEVVGFEAQELGDGSVKTDQTVNKVDKGGSVIGVRIDKL